LLLGLLLVGIALHGFHLGYKIVWHDEVYTLLRAAGYTSQEISDAIFQNQLLTPADLQVYQTIKPGSGAIATIQSLYLDDPQHPPLYFLLSRWWMQWFGSSITAMRSLAVLFSLLSLPFMYALALELFAIPQVAWVATVLLSLSPFDLLFAQTARQYSLLTLSVIASSLFLLRAWRLKTWRSWVWYAIAITVGLYGHPLFSMTIAAQGVYVVGLSLKQPQVSFLQRSWLRSRWSAVWKMGGAIALSSLLYSPWIWVILSRMGRASATTNWTRGDIGWLNLAKFWELSFTSLLIDLDVGFNNPLTYLIRLPFLILIGVAIYTVWRQTPLKTGLLILVSTLLPFLLLAIPDLILGGQRSAVTRYMISCYPTVQLAVAYWIARYALRGRLIGILLIVAVSSIGSCTVSAFTKSWWHQVPSYHNPFVIEYVNQQPNPVLISDSGNDGTNLGDLLSLSYGLRPNVSLLLLRKPADLATLNTLDAAGQSTFLLFRPSGNLVNQIQPQYAIETVSDAWQLSQLR
jgi:uncharacterized membrane protein